MKNSAIRAEQFGLTDYNKLLLPIYLIGTNEMVEKTSSYTGNPGLIMNRTNSTCNHSSLLLGKFW